MRCSGFTSVVLLVVTILHLPTAFAASWQTENLPAPEVVFSPSAVIALPRDRNEFSPTFFPTPLEPNRPVITEWTRSGRPGDPIQITGVGFPLDDSDGRGLAVLVYGQTSAGNGTLREATILSVTDHTVTAVLPEDLPPNSLYLVWCKTIFGVSEPVLVNHAEVWWTGPKVASSGGNLEIFGRNLSFAGGKERAFAALLDATGTARELTILRVDPYRIVAQLPVDLPAGEYSIATHNLHGGRFGWSNTLPVSVATPSPWSGPSFNVRDFGAVGDGDRDDSASFLAALAAARTVPRSTVVIPPGTYILRTGLNTTNIRLHGSGRDVTTVKLASDYSSHTTGSFLWSGETEITDLTVDLNGVSFPTFDMIRHRNNVSNITYRRVRLLLKKSGMDLHSASQVSLEDCEIFDKGIFLGSAS